MTQIRWKNFSWQTFNYIVSGMALILLWVLIAQAWSVEAFGRFSAIFSFTAIYGLCIELGLDFWATQQTSLGNKHAFSIQLIRFRCFWAAAIALVFCLIGRFLGYDFLTLSMFIFGALLLNIAHFFSCYLRGIDKLNVEAILSLSRHLIFVGLAIGGIYLGLTLWWVAASYLIANFLFGIATYLALKRFDFSVSSKGESLSGILALAVPVWITALLFGLSIKLDILLLERWGDATSLGQFSSVARVFEGGLSVGIAFALTLYPLLSRQMKRGLAAYPSLMLKTTKPLFLIAVFIALVGSFIGKDLFIFVFGDAYVQAAQLFEFFVYFYPLSILVIYLYNGLVIAHKSKQVIVILSAGVLVTLLLNWWLIPQFGATGALWTFMVKELVLLLSFIILLTHKKQWIEKTNEKI